MASSVRNRGLAPATAVFGEVGLSGEIRGIPQAALRVREAAQMGFTRIVHAGRPTSIRPIDAQADGRCELVGVRTVGEALDAADRLIFSRGGSKVHSFIPSGHP